VQWQLHVVWLEWWHRQKETDCHWLVFAGSWSWQQWYQHFCDRQGEYSSLIKMALIIKIREDSDEKQFLIYQGG